MKIIAYIILVICIILMLIGSYKAGYKLGQSQVVIKSVENMEVKNADNDNVVDGFKSMVDGKL